MWIIAGVGVVLVLLAYKKASLNSTLTGPATAAAASTGGSSFSPIGNLQPQSQTLNGASLQNGGPSGPNVYIPIGAINAPVAIQAPSGGYGGTSAGSSGFSSGTSGTGGSSGGGGVNPCFTSPVPIKTPTGFKEIGSLPRNEEFEIINLTGKHKARLIVHNFSGWMISLERPVSDKMVTFEHLIKAGFAGYIPASEKYPDSDFPRVWFTGEVFNIHTITDKEEDRNFILWNGDVAHNSKTIQY